MTKPRAQERPLTFDDVYVAHFDFVWSKLRAMGADDSDLEDLAHDVFVIVHRRLADYDASRPLRPWLFGIAYRVVVGARRRLRRTYEVQGDVERAPTLLTPEETVVDRQTAASVRAALATLDLERRALLLMHDVEGYSMPQIVEALEIPLNTAYSRLRLARRDLKLALGRLGGEP